MVIAVNASNWGDVHNVEQNKYAALLIKHLAIQYPENSIICIVPPDCNKLNVFPTNVKSVTVKRYNTSSMQWLYQQQVTIPLLFKKTRPAIIIQPNGVSCLFTKTPQLLLINLKAVASFTDSSYWLIGPIQHFFTSIMLKKAARIITGAEEAYMPIQQQYPFLHNQLTLVNGGPYFNVLPFQWEEKEEFKQQYTAGCEYFLIAVNGVQVNDVLTVLKAFSQFKKWQKSNMKLLITGSIKDQSGDFFKKLKSYKYREDIILLTLPTEKELQQVIGAAYAAILLPNAEGLSLTIIQWMQSAVPVIVAKNDTGTTIAENAAIQASLKNPPQLAEYMQLLYRDEKYRETYISRGLEWSKSFNWNQSAVSLWEEITKTVNLSH